MDCRCLNCDKLLDIPDDLFCSLNCADAFEEEEFKNLKESSEG